jgi:hypothetical protein
MYTKYMYVAGATAANILADVSALLTGETNKANLSASCDQTNTDIDASARVAGWTSYDASAGTNARCFRAAVADNASQYKYLVIDTNTAGYILTKGYELWNSGTHAGTNLIYTSDLASTSAQRLLVASGGRLDISASVRHCAMFSLQGGVYGNTSNNGPTGLFERTRKSPWDTVANGYPPIFFLYSEINSIYESRFVSSTGTDVLSSNAGCRFLHAFGSVENTLPTTSVISDTGKSVFGHVMVPFGNCRASHGHLGGDASSFADIWLTTYNSGSPYDTVVYGGNTYNIWTSGITWRYAVRQG